MFKRTVASALNSLAAVTIQDLLKDGLKLEFPEQKAALYGKWLSLFYGVISFCLIFIIERLGSSVLEIAISFNGIVGGVTLGLFTLGMLIPQANKYGAILGSISSFLLVLWLGIGSQLTSSTNLATKKFTSAEKCDCQFNETLASKNEVFKFNESETSNQVVSYLWYSMIGTVLTVTIGTIVSYMTGIESLDNIDKDLLSPVILRFIGNNKTKKPLNNNLKLSSVDNSVIHEKSDYQKDGIFNIAIDLSDEFTSNDITKL